jgi:hypothetical protein
VGLANAKSDGGIRAAPKMRGTQRKRMPNAVKVALCQSALSPYLIHPAKPYKKENIHALEVR